MKRSILMMSALGILVCIPTSPALAQRGRGGGPPVGRGPSATPGAEKPGGSAGNHSDATTAASSPAKVLSHNTALAGKIQALTGGVFQDATTACTGFKNVGRCFAAAHVAKNLDLTGGFTALRSMVTGNGAVSLGEAIKNLRPDVDAKAEVKKAQKQADDDLKESSTDTKSS